ncbi:MAG: MurR/RpiR family transcriptional regulator [Beijerinckiaceae bacterium]|nr:MurR/RpiR family transcriptional regulator [Beijerinckiaceae bacterium]MCZ8300249.1 MurR/RpiR family transcriptional regulator [Beijerinckiaceae bacterium]
MLTNPQAPETFDALRQRIRDRFDGLSPHLQRIARASLVDPNTFALSTTAALGEALEIQPSTLIRFAKEFGYSGFSDLQRVFRQRLIEGAATVRDKVLDSTPSSAAADIGAILADSIAVHRQALESLLETCDHAALGRAIDAIRAADHVYVAGLRRSRPIADYLLYGLMRSERPCSLLDFAGGMAGSQIATIRPDDVLVAIAFPPYSPPVLEAVMDAHISGRRVVTITDSDQSPLAVNSHVCLTVASSTPSRMQPIGGAIALVHAILTAITPGAPPNAS